MIIKYKELTLDNIIPELLNDFNRHEEVYKAWRTEDGVQSLKDIRYTEDWNKKDLEEVYAGLKNTIIKGGSVFGAFQHDILVGFASLEHEFFGSKNQYIQLSMLHITSEYRHMGIGKALFSLCVHKAVDFKAKKLYISASSCENGQLFYKGLGCIPADELNESLFLLEPYDCHLEFNCS